MQTIRNNYFDGRPFLFPDAALRLETAIEMAETLAEEYDCLGCATQERRHDGEQTTDNGPAESLLIDLAAIRAQARAEIRPHVALLVRMAKAAAVADRGRNEEAARLAREAYRNRPQHDGQHD